MGTTICAEGKVKDEIMYKAIQYKFTQKKPLFKYNLNRTLIY